jgi:hypothetical protein
MQVHHGEEPMLQVLHHGHGEVRRVPSNAQKARGQKDVQRQRHEDV